ncbi:MAG TPA: ATP-binding protein, partial [Candidatus Limnocylindrales bacterium]|nr:ATP-binding protein [Candidatus Limnocylindrales bacterium]
NAVKFTPTGTVTVSARLATPGEIEVAVADSGIGIAPADHEKVWEQFGQAGGDTLTDKPRGTGLGLPISRQIVEHHGGRMSLESAPGAGSTFRFTLPVRDDAGV